MTKQGTSMTISRIALLAILSLAGCENKKSENPVIGEIQQIESPLQNTLEGMAKALPEPERNRLISRAAHGHAREADIR